MPIAQKAGGNSAKSTVILPATKRQQRKKRGNTTRNKTATAHSGAPVKQNFCKRKGAARYGQRLFKFNFQFNSTLVFLFALFALFVLFSFGGCFFCFRGGCFLSGKFGFFSFFFRLFSGPFGAAFVFNDGNVSFGAFAF